MSDEVGDGIKGFTVLLALSVLAYVAYQFGISSSKSACEAEMQTNSILCLRLSAAVREEKCK